MWYPNRPQCIILWVVGLIVCAESFGAFDAGGFVVSAIIIGDLLF